LFVGTSGYSGYIGINVPDPEVQSAWLRIVKPADSTVEYAKFTDDTDVDVFSVSASGYTFANMISGDTATYNTGIFGTSGYISLSDTVADFKTNITLQGTLSGTATTDPLVDTHAGSTTVPMFQWTGDLADAFYLQVTDDDNSVALSLKGKTLYAQVGSFDKLSAGATLVTTGDYNLANYTGATYVCDCTAGAVTFTLPEIVLGSTLSGETYIFTKSDVTTNGVLISGQQGQTINGEASYLISDRWESVKIMAIIGPGPTPLTFWVTV
jgi:hypothetical protein